MAEWTPERKLANRQRLHARRVYKKNPMFAVEVIQQRYPDYTDEQLLKDLIRKRKSKPKRKKKKPITDFRRCQLLKYKTQLKFVDQESAEYNKILVTMAILHNAHTSREDIPIPVKKAGEVKVYYFHWDTRESSIKGFITYANQKDVTIEMLDERRSQMSDRSIKF